MLLPGWSREEVYYIAERGYRLYQQGRLLEAGILVKNLHGWHPLLDNCLRVTVGTPGENDLVIEALSRMP